LTCHIEFRVRKKRRVHPLKRSKPTITSHWIKKRGYHIAQHTTGIKSTMRRLSQANKEEDSVVDECRRLLDLDLDQQASTASQSRRRRAARSRPFCVTASIGRSSSSSSRLLLRASLLSILLLLSHLSPARAQGFTGQFSPTPSTCTLCLAILIYALSFSASGCFVDH
jgi:hypothetical protein